MLTPEKVRSQMVLEDGAFKGQSPWFGPYLGRYACYVSSTGERLTPGKSYIVEAFVFSGEGQLLRRGELGAISAKGGANFDLSGLTAGLPQDTKGSIAIVTIDPAAEKFELLAETWMIRFVDNGSLIGVINSATAPFINFPEKTGRKSRYRMVSQAIDISGDMRPVSCHINASANPAYNVSSTFRVKVYNHAGDVLASHPHAVPAFGCAWFDLVSEFGDKLGEHLRESGGRGAYTVESDDAAAVGYHFIFSRSMSGMAADHTRPIIKYLDMGYGEDPLKQPRSMLAGARSMAGAMKFTWFGHGRG